MEDTQDRQQRIEEDLSVHPTSNQPQSQLILQPSVVPGKVVIVDDNVNVILPTLDYGYRTTKATWPELVQIINVEKNIPKMSRSEQQQHDYEVFRYHMKRQYISSVDYILISKFVVEAVEAMGDDENEPKMWKASMSLAQIHTPMTVLVPNDFPYYVEDGINHYIYWKLKHPITDHEIENVQEQLRLQFGALDVLYWVNPPALQSLPEIDHVHFLFRTET